MYYLNVCASNNPVSVHHGYVRDNVFEFDRVHDHDHFYPHSYVSSSVHDHDCGMCYYSNIHANDHVHDRDDDRVHHVNVNVLSPQPRGDVTPPENFLQTICEVRVAIGME